MQITAITDTVTQVTAQCPFCSYIGSLPVPTVAYNMWQHGYHAQNVFGWMTPEWREFFFLSHTCPDCWDAYWSDDSYDNPF